MKEHPLFAIIKSDISAVICKTLCIHHNHIPEELLNLMANEYTDKILVRIKEGCEICKDTKSLIDMANFEFIWQKYPQSRRVGKKIAIKHYNASVKNTKDCMDIEKALFNYLASSTVKQGYIQHASTWFNNWRDWIDIVPIKIEQSQFRKCEKCGQGSQMIDGLCATCFEREQGKV